MCGLISAFYPDSVEPPSAETLQQNIDASLEIIKYRGPDSRGIYVSPDGRVGLGHVRLSIIDLETGQQPLSDEENSIHCVVTGEIYDHDRIRAEMVAQGYKFQTKSDSELVVQLYKRDGFNLLTHLRGEFAFVLYDVKRKLQFVARDRFGIKPLYYTVSNGCILFGSEIKTFMPLGWQAEWDIDSIVHQGDFGDERTVFKGVKKLAAGYYAVCRASGDLETRPYWDLSYSSATATPSESIETMISNVRDLLVNAVRLRLRSDVPWAVYLSGGIDSSSVAGIATKLLREKDPNAKLTTFTLAYVEDPATDESPLAERTANFIGADLIKVEATEAKLVGFLEDAMYHCEHVTNTFHGAGKLLLSKAVRDAGFKVKVALSGEGSDEVFAGYPWFPLDYLRSPDPVAAQLGIPLPTDAERHALSEEYQANTRMPQFMDVQLHTGNKNLLDIGAHRTLEAIWSFAGGAKMFKKEVIERVGEPDVARCIAEGVEYKVRENSVSGRWHALHVSLYTTAKTLMGRTILNIAGDRADMAHAIESRPAFLDHHLVDYVNSLPASLKIRPIQNPDKSWTMVEKWILRQAMQPFITDEIFLRKKVPFNPPPANKPPGDTDLVLPLQAHLKARLTQESVERVGFLDWPSVEEVLDGYTTAATFPGKGAIDARARVLMSVLSYVVFQEKFGVPTYKV
ncbi:asparagine synthetase domain-containing protein [Favolaschia claudopus]|uniref:Asparagine synthetase domain-containing protein n=1 Tax=Favolaschia claudopus TaxID=2862362 RepID=A0AAV9ZCE6_9AGAR